MEQQPLLHRRQRIDALDVLVLLAHGDLYLWLAELGDQMIQLHLIQACPDEIRGRITASAWRCAVVDERTQRLHKALCHPFDRAAPMHRFAIAPILSQPAGSHQTIDPQQMAPPRQWTMDRSYRFL